jgi:hypothetical protein
MLLSIVIYFFILVRIKYPAIILTELKIPYIISIYLKLNTLTDGCIKIMIVSPINNNDRMIILLSKLSFDNDPKQLQLTFTDNDLPRCTAKIKPQDNKTIKINPNFCVFEYNNRREDIISAKIKIREYIRAF